MRFKKGLAVVAASVMTLSAMTGCSNKVSKDKFSTTAGATYGDEKIYLDEFLFYTKLNQASMDNMYNYYKAWGYMEGISLEQFYQQPYTEELTAWQVVKEEVVSTVYQTRVLNDYAKEHNITLSDKDLEKVEEEVKEYTEGEHKYLLDGTNISEETIRRIITANALANRAHDQMGEGYDTTVDRSHYRVAHAYYFTVAKDNDSETDEAGRAFWINQKYRNAFEKAGNKIEDVDLDTIKADLAEPEGAEHKVSVYVYKDQPVFVGQVAAQAAKEAEQTEEEKQAEEGTATTQITKLVRAVSEMSAGEFKEIEDDNAYYVLYLSEEDNEKSTQEKIDAEYETRKEAKFVEDYKELLKTAKKIKVNNTAYDANIVYQSITYPTQAPTETPVETTPAETTTDAATTTEAETTTEAVTTTEAEAPTEAGTTASDEEITTEAEASEEAPTSEEATAEAVNTTEEVPSEEKTAEE